MNNIEVEERALLTKNEYGRISQLLKREGEDLGQDDKNVFFYIFPDKLIKLVDEITQDKAKIVYKSNHIANSRSLEEIEVSIDRNDFAKFVDIFNKLMLTDKILQSFQQRHNYAYHGCEIALKYSDSWGFHLEAEMVVNERKEIAAAKNKLKSIEEQLGVKFLSKEELRTITSKHEAGYERGEKDEKS